MWAWDRKSSICVLHPTCGHGTGRVPFACCIQHVGMGPEELHLRAASNMWAWDQKNSICVLHPTCGHGIVRAPFACCIQHVGMGPEELHLRAASNFSFPKFPTRSWKFKAVKKVCNLKRRLFRTHVHMILLYCFGCRGHL
jgi:hypothetical protein